MCLIVFKRDDASQFTNRQFKNMIHKNKDGLGIMYLENDRVVVNKSMGDEEEKFRMFKELRNKTTYIMHARFATHGLVNEDNCHPYKLLSIDDGDPMDLYVVHNGVLKAPSIDKDMSDTWHYMEYVIKPIVKADINLLWENKYIQEIIEAHMGGSKLVFMRSDDVEFQILILNQKAGSEVTGCWLSNLHGCSDPYVAPKHNYNNGYSHYNRWSSEDDTWVNGKCWDNKAQKWVWTDDAAPKPPEKEAHKITKTYPEQKEYIKDGVLYLPKPTEDDKIVHLRQPKSLVNLAGDPVLLKSLRSLRGQSEAVIKDWIEQDADHAADVATELQSPRRIEYDIFMRIIKYPNGLNNMANLIRQMVQDEERQSSNIKIAK